MDKESIQRLLDEFLTAKQKGDLDRQINVIRQLLSIAQQQVDLIAEIEFLRRLGNLYQEKGELQKAHAYRLAAVELVDDPLSQCPLEQKMLVIGDLGRSFIEAKIWTKGEEYTRQALSMAQKINDIQVECIYKINLQIVLDKTGRSEQALRMVDKILKDAETIPAEPDGEKNYILGLEYLYLASYHIGQLHINECQRHARKALAHAERAQNQFLRFRAQQIMGKSYVWARRIIGRREYSAEAEQYLHEVVEIGRMGGDVWVEAETENELGRLYEHRESPVESLQHYRRALDLLETVRRNVGYEEFQLAYFRSLQPIYEHATTYFLKQKKVEDAFHALEKLRSRLLLAHLGEKNTNKKLKEAEQQQAINDVLDQYGSSALQEIYGDGKRGKKRGIALGEKPIRLGEKNSDALGMVDVARNEFFELYNTYQTQQANWMPADLTEAIRVEEAQNSLEHDEAMLLYWTMPDSLLIFVVTPDDYHFQHLTYPLKKLECDVSEIVENIYALQSQVLDPFVIDQWFGRNITSPWPKEIEESLESLHGKAEKLYALLIVPVLSLIAKYSHWTILPSGPLHQLPWSALRTPKHYLIEEHTLSFLPSASSGSAIKNLPLDNSSKAIFVADPDSDDWKLNLPASQEEIRTAQKTLQADAELLIGSDATKENLLKHIESARLVHLACHHVFDVRSPLLSFLKLAGNNGRNFLYAFEISELDLSAELVSVSACQSGRSRTDAGDEQYGIVRAFLAAGAHSVISTLWAIEDVSAATFFTHFYELAKQYPLAKAMQKSQIALIKDHRYCLPSFWAPYTLSGRWDHSLESMSDY